MCFTTARRTLLTHSDPFCWVAPQILSSPLPDAHFLLCAELIFPSSRRWKPEAELMLLGSQEVRTHKHTHTHVLLRSEKREVLKNDTGLEAIVIIH